MLKKPPRGASLPNTQRSNLSVRPKRAATRDITALLRERIATEEFLPASNLSGNNLATGFDENRTNFLS